MKNYYKILEIQKDAAQLEIKKSYYLLAKKYHPDSNDNNDVKKIFEKKMSLINEAYEILSNNEKRILYDLTLSKKNIKSTNILKKLFSKIKIRK